MCFGIPMKIISIDGFIARCEAKSIKRDINLFMLQDDSLVAGDYLVVQKGRAIEKIPEQQALAAWKIYDEMLELEKNQV